MFESIAILPKEVANHPLNIGDLAEKMLYYKNVIVFAHKTEFKKLFEYFDSDLLVEYLKRGYIKIVNRKKSYGIGQMGKDYLGEFFYDKNYDLKKIIYSAYLDFSGDVEKSKKVANKLYRHIGIYETPQSFINEINFDLADQSFIKKAIIQNANFYRPNEGLNQTDFDFIVTPLSSGLLKIESSLDLNKYPFLDPNSVVLNIATAIESTKIAANYNSELSVPILNSKLISVKMNSLIEKATKSEKDIEVFKYAEFPDTPSLQEIINQKHKSMADFIKVLDAGNPFKDWLNSLGEGNKLIKEYTAKVKEKTWIQKAPAKVGRFYLIQGLSTILKATGTLTGIAAGIGLSAANTFLADRLVKGWRPNHFIEEEVVPFIKSAGGSKDDK